MAASPQTPSAVVAGSGTDGVWSLGVAPDGDLRIPSCQLLEINGVWLGLLNAAREALSLHPATFHFHLFHPLSLAEPHSSFPTPGAS